MAITYTNQAVTTGNAGPIESRADYTGKSGRFNYWSDELKGSQEMLKRWHRQADRIHQRFLDQRTREASSSSDEHAAFKLNLFFSNTSTLLALLYGNLPTVDVSRRYADARDDVGRVAGEIIERLLNNDVQDNSETMDAILKAVLQDRLVPGLGVARIRYDAEVETVTRAAVIDQTTGEVLAAETTEEVISDESAPVDYYHWRDVLWSWSRTFGDLRWLAYRNWLTKDQATERYGKKVADELNYKQQKMTVETSNNDAPDIPEHNDNWLKAEVWEIWDKDEREIVEIHLGYQRVLKTTPDPLKLRNFFPSPALFIANPTTSLYLPTPDWHMAQDLYNEIDKLQTRIAVITEAVKVVGVYDVSTPEIAQMLKEGIDNKLIPVPKYALFAEKGGIQGAIDWFPIEDVVNALVNLRQLRDETIALLYQITGMADVMRGELANQYEGVGQTDTKVQFGSIRVQSIQEQFAAFVSGLMRLKAEVVAKHFAPETIVKKSNIEHSFETPELIEAAVALIKDPAALRLQVKVKAESLATTDYARMQAERGEFLTGLSGFMQAAAPLLEQSPSAAPYLMQLLQWGLAGFRGADEIEGVIDQAIVAIEEAEKQAQANPRPDPEVQKEQAKAQGQVQLVQAKAQAEAQTREHDKQADIETQMAAHRAKIAEIEAGMRAKLAEIEAKAQADMATEQFQSQVNVEQHAQGVEAELHKDVVTHRLDLDAKAEETALKIREAEAVAATKPTPKEGSSSD